MFAKSMLDFVAAIVFASSLGLGVIFSAVFVLVYQGAITLGGTVALTASDRYGRSGNVLRRLCDYYRVGIEYVTYLEI